MAKHRMDLSASVGKLPDPSAVSGRVLLLTERLLRRYGKPLCLSGRVVD